ncbi:MAG TPA: hypothetical protein VIK89_03510 [Cytophagaceae bacterium]
MKKQFFIALVLIFIFNAAAAQEVNVNMGPEFMAAKRSTLSGIIGYDQTGYYVLQSKLRGLNPQTMLAHFDNQLSLTKQVELSPSYEGKELIVESIVYMDGKIYLFTSFKNHKLGKKFLFYQTVNKSTLTPNNDLKKIEEIELNKSKDGDYWFTTSKDTSKILCIKNLPNDKDEPESFGIKVFDSKMQLLWEKSVELPYAEKLFDISKYIMSNEGHVYILGRLYEGKAKETRKGKVNYQYKIFAYNRDKSEKEITVSLGDKYITDLQMGISDAGEFICSGFYSNMGTHSIDGTYFLKIDPKNNKVLSRHAKEFPTDFLTQYVTEKEAKKIEKQEQKGKDFELYEYDLDELIVREDGGAYLIGEQYYVRVVTTTYSTGNGGYSTRTTYYYNYHDIIVISFNRDGSIEWCEKVPKRQVSTNDGGFYSSYVRALYNDRLYFIFNDHIDNLQSWSTGKLKNYTAGQNGVVTLVSLTREGKQNRTMLYKAKDIETITVPKVCEQISKNELIIYGQKKKTHQFSRVVFK